MKMVTDISDELMARLAEAGPALPGADLPWLMTLRERAVSALSQAGLPTVRSEGWRHTNPATVWPALLENPEAVAMPATDEGDSAGLLTAGACHRMTLVDGAIIAEPQMPDGIHVTTLGKALESDDGRIAAALSDALENSIERLSEFPLGALNLAFMVGGYVVIAEDNAVLDRPLDVVIKTTKSGPLPCLRNLILAGANSRVEVIESYVGSDDVESTANYATQILCGPGASVSRSKLQSEGDRARHLASTYADVSKAARLENFELSLGAVTSRSEAILRLNGEGASLSYNGAYLMRGQQHCDHTTWIDHQAAHTESRETFKGVIDDDGHAVFQGRITVRPGTRQVDGHQLNKTLLLSDGAEINSKPELEIYADDVKCAHGATSGRIDGDQLFYLRARGIAEQEARAMLIEAFLGEALELIGREEIRDSLGERVSAWFKTGKDKETA
jgi:Fe-S cluster assembly protein SufD